jgi:hypothetical protein
MFKKSISLILSLSLIFTFVSPNIFANNNSAGNNEYGFEVVQNDDHIVTVKGEHNGDELYATLNRDNNEYTMQVVEKPQGLLSALVATESDVTEYAVKPELIDGDVVEALIINKDTGEELKLEQNTDTVTAQLPLLVPVLEWGGSALLAFLLKEAAALAIGAITAYLVTDLIADIKKQKEYNYWKAWVRRGDVYIAPDAFRTDGDAFTYLKTSNNTDVNLFAKTSAKAEQAAKKVTGYAKWAQNEKTTDGYYPHYHPIERTGEQFENHVWYYPGT